MNRRPRHPRGELVDGYRITEHPLYVTHTNMLRRCLKPSDPGYKNYGGRGIKVCRRWLDFRNFVADMGPKPTPAHTLERKDNSKGYGPNNCKWATRTEQCINRRRFTNNTSGETGVIKTESGWHARFDYEGGRYSVGWYKTRKEAAAARTEFVTLFFNDKGAALLSLQDRVRSNSSTGVRGVTPCEDGFIARCTINGERHYIGYFKDFNDAVRARKAFIASRDGRIAGRVARTAGQVRHKQD